MSSQRQKTPTQQLPLLLAFARESPSESSTSDEEATVLRAANSPAESPRVAPSTPDERLQTSSSDEPDGCDRDEEKRRRLRNNGQTAVDRFEGEGLRVAGIR